MHGDKYDYTQVMCTTRKNKVKINCAIHGEFSQSVDLHLRGGGCPKCGWSSYNTDTFIKKAESIHGKKFNYSKVNYKTNDQKVRIICPEHGSFEQVAADHLKGRGCRKCANVLNGHQKRLDIKDVKYRAKLIHKNIYEYRFNQFKNLQTPVEIICPIHGAFKQRMADHLKGTGCPRCAIRGINYNKPTILYYIKDIETGTYKIGITTRSVAKRFIGRNKRIIVLKIWEMADCYDALELEQFILEEAADERILNESFGDGKTEFFSKDILHLDKGK